MGHKIRPVAQGQDPDGQDEAAHRGADSPRLRGALRRILRVACALAIAAGALLLAGKALETRDPTRTEGVLYPYVYGYSKLEQGSLDVLVVGDSSAMTGISPAVIQDETGLSSYNAGCPNQSIELSAELVDDVWNYQSPRYVVLEVNDLFTETSTDLAVKSMLERALPVLRNHNNWKLLVQGKLDEDGPALTSDLGYYPSDDVVASTHGDYMANNAQPDEIPFWSQVYLEHIQRTCEEHGATLVLVSTPNASEWSQSKHDLVTAWAAEHGVTYLDGNTEESVGIDWSEDTRDGGMHLNRQGATKFSTWLASKLAEL